MAMHLIDRPELAHSDLGHRGLSGVASAALHAVAAVILILAMRAGSADAVQQTARVLIPQHLIWLPHTDVGGGRDSGGDRSRVPPRQARQIGQDSTTVPAAPPDPSPTIADPPPEDTSNIPAKPMADATQALAGVMESNNASTTLGPGTGGSGTSEGTDRGGLGNRPWPGFGLGDATRGGPGVTFPIPIEQVKPAYTADAMRARVQGSVMIECVVMPDGSVGDLRILRSLDRQFGLDEEALKAARRWRFRPGRLHGEPVPVVVTIELMFSVR